MATTDNSIPLDLKFFDFLYDYRYPNSTPEERRIRREMCASGEIQIETMLENTLAIVGNLTKDSVAGRDFTDNSDSKKCVSQLRKKKRRGTYYDSYYDVNTYHVQNVKNKTGTLRIMAYNKLADRFDFFVIPNHAYNHTNLLEITLCNVTGELGYGQYRKYRVNSFYELATKP